MMNIPCCFSVITHSNAYHHTLRHISGVQLAFPKLLSVQLVAPEIPPEDPKKIGWLIMNRSVKRKASNFSIILHFFEGQ